MVFYFALLKKEKKILCSYFKSLFTKENMQE